MASWCPSPPTSWPAEPPLPGGGVPPPEPSAARAGPQMDGTPGTPCPLPGQPEPVPPTLVPRKGFNPPLSPHAPSVQPGPPSSPRSSRNKALEHGGVAANAGARSCRPRGGLEEYPPPGQGCQGRPFWGAGVCARVPGATWASSTHLGLSGATQGVRVCPAVPGSTPGSQGPFLGARTQCWVSGSISGCQVPFGGARVLFWVPQPTPRCQHLSLGARTQCWVPGSLSGCQGPSKGARVPSGYKDPVLGARTPPPPGCQHPSQPPNPSTHQCHAPHLGVSFRLPQHQPVGH